MDHAAMSETVYAKSKELTEEQKAERDEREERELGGWESEGLRQTIFITLEEADSSVAAKIVSLVVMVVIFLSSCTFKNSTTVPRVWVEWGADTSWQSGIT